MTVPSTIRDAVLRIGEVTAVEGRLIYVLVDKRKNLSHMFLDGELLTNIAVSSYLDIRKGFLSIIGRVEGERIEDDFRRQSTGSQREPTDRSRRILTISLAGYIDEHGAFRGGARELPLIGNEAFLLTPDKLRRVHDLTADAPLSISIATLFGDDSEVRLPVDGLFNSHIAIFGNTGSGKSNTLAYLYQELIRALRDRNVVAFEANTKFVILDFNGEYASQTCITEQKTIYNLSTRTDADRLPLGEQSLLELEVLAILADATEKTQKPFVGRALNLVKRIKAADDGQPEQFFKNLLRKLVRKSLETRDRLAGATVINYFKQILPDQDHNGNEVDIRADLEWHNGQSQFIRKPGPVYLADQPQEIVNTVLHGHVSNAVWGQILLDDIIRALYVQLIDDVLAHRAINEHIAPVINRLRRKRDDIQRVFDLTGDGNFWTSNVVVVNLQDVNLEMRKTIPLLLAKRLYDGHKKNDGTKTLTMVIDEAHNILSTESFREAESWKDYRLETFEEIIKEGRKFGVFVTIASQRPNDISPTITSQAHNYFIHRLINERDLKMIASAVSYIDRATEESIPTLATGTCVFSGVITAMPMKLNVKRLALEDQPRSATREFNVVVPSQGQGE